MDGLVIVSGTALPESDFFGRAPLGRSLLQLQSLRVSIETDIAFQNRDGLSVLYNRAIEKWQAHPDRVLLFVHDDVYLNDVFLFEKLEQGLADFALVGIAGSTAFSLSAHQVGWHASSTPECWAGGVLHPLDDRRDGPLYFHGYGSAPRETLVVDGVFMAASVGALGDVRFDEQFSFDFYDLDFCLQLRSRGKRIGVLPIVITHLSQGGGIWSERFKSLQPKFVAKWRAQSTPAPRAGLRDRLATCLGKRVPPMLQGDVLSL